MRLLGRAMKLIGAYVALLLAVLVAGFVANRLGIWAAVLWALLLLAGLVLFLRRQSTPRS